MIELTTTRSNPMIDPSMHVWGWEIPVYLYLGGLVAGMMILTGYLLFSGRHKKADCACFLAPSLGLALLTLGMGALFLDLEHKPFFWRLYTTLEWTSPMSWGAWILILVYPAMLAALLLRVPAPLARRFPAMAELSERLLARPIWARAVGFANIGLGILLGIYTGILLSALGARPLWSSAMLGPLFLISGLSTAAALVHMIARNPEERVLFARADNVFLGTELLFLFLFLIGLLGATEVHARAARMLLDGSFGALFWVGVVGAGIVLPLGIQIAAVRHKIQHTPVAPILVLAGGLVLRFVLVAAGQASHWSGL